MGIKINRVGSTCERCGNITSKELKVTHYTENDNDVLLCDECLQKVRKELENDRKARNQKCAKCDQLVWKHGGLVDDGKKKYCKECYNVIEDKLFLKEKRKDFLKKNWYNWIFIGIAIAGLLITSQLI